MMSNNWIYLQILVMFLYRLYERSVYVCEGSVNILGEEEDSKKRGQKGRGETEQNIMIYM